MSTKESVTITMEEFMDRLTLLAEIVQRLSDLHPEIWKDIRQKQPELLKRLKTE